ncbi:MAG: ribosome silencing factor [Bacteroidales bacterium]|jgi:ribosome-associated protein
MAKRKRTTDDQTLLMAIVEAMHDKKAYDVISIDFSGLKNTVCDYFVICHGTNKPQVQAISESVYGKLRKEYSVHPSAIEGARNAEWILMDYGSIVVHIFQENTRRFYNLETLWADAEFTRHEIKQ